MSPKKSNGLNETDVIVAGAIDAADSVADNTVTLSSGVVLKCRQANPNVLIRVMTARERPDVPEYFNESMGRMMENPNDPDYLKRVQAWEMHYNNSMLNALIGLGTELVSKPKGMPGPDDESWIRDYASYGLPTHPESKAWCYVTWVLFKAAVIDKDTQAIGAKVKELSGVKEADVKSAETFPGSNKKG